MTPNIPSPEKIEQLQTLTRRYSVLVNNAGGLSYFVVAVMFGVVFFTIKAWGLELMPRIFLCLLAFTFWVYVRNYFRQNYYQTLGIVKESRQPWKPKPDPKRKIKLAIFFAVYFVFVILIPAIAFLRSDSVTLEKILYFLLYLVFCSIVGFYMGKSRVDFSFFIPVAGFLAIALYDIQLIFDFQDREGSMIYSLLLMMFCATFAGIFEHIRYQRVTKEIIELQRSL
jgi:hypothetical protein